MTIRSPRDVALEAERRGVGIMIAARLAYVAAIVLGTSSPHALAHELPTFPRVRLLSVLEHPWEPASRILVVEVRDPAGREPLIGAQVLVSGIEKERGSALRVPEQWLAPTLQPGVYQGRVEFPGRGVRELTLTVIDEGIFSPSVEAWKAAAIGWAATNGILLLYEQDGEHPRRPGADVEELLRTSTALFINGLKSKERA